MEDYDDIFEPVFNRAVRSTIVDVGVGILILLRSKTRLICSQANSKAWLEGPGIQNEGIDLLRWENVF